MTDALTLGHRVHFQPPNLDFGIPPANNSLPLLLPFSYSSFKPQPKLCAIFSCYGSKKCVHLCKQPKMLLLARLALHLVICCPWP